MKLFSLMMINLAAIVLYLYTWANHGYLMFFAIATLQIIATWNNAVTINVGGRKQ
jgi:hypothetical protein